MRAEERDETIWRVETQLWCKNLSSFLCGFGETHVTGERALNISPFPKIVLFYSILFLFHFFSYLAAKLLFLPLLLLLLHFLFLLFSLLFFSNSAAAKTDNVVDGCRHVHNWTTASVFYSGNEHDTRKKGYRCSFSIFLDFLLSVLSLSPSLLLLFPVLNN